MTINTTINRRVGTLVAALGLVVGSLFLASPATAGSCEYDSGSYTSSDWAWTERVSGTCSGVKVRHHYDPIWSSTNYWTPWDYDSSFAFSAQAAELFDSQHNYFNG